MAARLAKWALHPQLTARVLLLLTLLRVVRLLLLLQRLALLLLLLALVRLLLAAAAVAVLTVNPRSCGLQSRALLSGWTMCCCQVCSLPS
jgi:hypothetical protein